MQPAAKEIEVNDLYIPYINEQSRFLILFGGGGSGKSVFACFKVCLRTVTEKGHKFLVFRKVASTIKESVFSEIKAMLSDMSVLHEFEINKTDKSFTHQNGNQIICMGLDEPEKIKSIKGITGIWVEELTEFEETDYDQINIRIRGKKENYVQILACFNPISEDHWAVKRFVTTSKLEDNTAVVKSTHLDNYFLSFEDRQQLLNLKDRNPLFYDIYCLGIPGVVDKTNKFMYSFDESKQVRPVTLNENLPIWASLDFNIDPMTAIIAQRVDLNTLVCKKCIQLDNSDIYEMIDRIRAEFPQYYIVFTGDASGHNRTGAVRGKTSFWQIIKHELALKDLNMKVRTQNIGLIESRVLCNAVNQAVTIILDPEGCKPLINDCKFGQVDDHGVLVKDRKKQKNDFLDGFRYLIDANFYDFLGKQNKYKR